MYEKEIRHTNKASKRKTVTKWQEKYPYFGGNDGPSSWRHARVTSPRLRECLQNLPENSAELPGILEYMVQNFNILCAKSDKNLCRNRKKCVQTSAKFEIHYLYQEAIMHHCLYKFGKIQDGHQTFCKKWFSGIWGNTSLQITSKFYIMVYRWEIQPKFHFQLNWPKFKMGCQTLKIDI